ncbi:hypothetical protein FO519_010502 [Halicephalobus sp. NKZ332]|nr:hypothetical protein FO519_010502 [Halicephalobus sp. NKZ332]
MEEIARELSKIETFHDLLLITSNFHGDKVAIINAENESKKVTFSQLRNTALKVSNFLLEEAGLKKQETVGILMPNRWEHIAIHIGTSLSRLATN